MSKLLSKPKQWGRVYIAGPMTGKEQFNFAAFDEAKRVIEWAGIVAVSPADMDRARGFDALKIGDGPVSWDDPVWALNIMGITQRELMGECCRAVLECDAIYLLPGWEKSKGAQMEYAVAMAAGLDVASEPRDVLDEAAEITRGDRQASYGPPDQDFARTAALWNVLFTPFCDVAADGSAFLNMPPRAVAMAMIALKLSREVHQKKRDNPVDIAGYARCMDMCVRAEADGDNR